VAGLIGYTRVLRLKRSWRAPCVLWSVVVADSGSLKTPAFRMATDYLFKLQKRLDLEFERKHAAHAKAKEVWDAAVKAAKHNGGRGPGDEPEPPVRPTIFASDATIEAIAELIGDNPRGLLVACDELAGWLGSFKRYKGKAGGSDLQRWLSMHSAAGFAYHRRTGDKRRIIVPHAAVSVCGGIQPGILASALGEEFFAAGLAARLLLAMPPRPVKTWTELEVAPEIEEAYHTLLDHLLVLDFARDATNQPVPHTLNFSPEAKAAWVNWYTAWANEQVGVEGELAAAFSKLEEAAARFALIHHVVSAVGRGVDDRSPVDVESIEAGVTLTRWFAGEARRIYATLSESAEDRDARRLVEFIRARGGSITARALQKSNGRRYPSAESDESALDALEQMEMGGWKDRPAGPQGGHPSRCFVLNPSPDTTDTTSAGADDDGVECASPSPDRTTTDLEISRDTGGCVGSVGRLIGPETAGAGASPRRRSGQALDGHRAVASDEQGPPDVNGGDDSERI
jgi:hypothetical protein